MNGWGTKRKDNEMNDAVTTAADSTSKPFVGDVKPRVRAKFKVDGKKPYNESEPETGGAVSLSPVYSGSPENEQFYKWTPGGNISLSTVNGAAFGAFEVGKEYYVDFTPAS